MSYSLKNLPECYPRPISPKTSRWLIALVGLLALNVILMQIFGRYVDSKHFRLFSIGIPIFLWAVCFGLRICIWFLQDSKANGFDRQREQWILRETRRTRRALQVLKVTFITGHPEEEQAIVATAMQNNQSIIISQADWAGNDGQRMSQIDIGQEDTPQSLITSLLSRLVTELPIDQFPERAALVVLLDVSSPLSFSDIRELWQEVWDESGIACSVEYVAGSGLGVLDHWLDQRIKDDVMLLIVGLQVAPTIPDKTAETAVAILLGNRLTQNVLEPLALLHRPDPAQQGELDAGMKMAAYNVPIKENIVKHFWIAGVTGAQRAEVIECQNAHPAQSVEDDDVISLDASMGHAGVAAPWLAIAAATEIARQTQSPQMIICGDTTQDVLWSTLVTPIASREEMDL